jgi:hypothetical protein
MRTMTDDQPELEGEELDALAVFTDDALPVVTEVRAIERVATPLPTVQAAAVAASGFVAGAATLALVRRRSARRARRSGLRRPARAPGALPVLSSKSFLIDVHVLGRPGD